MSNLNLYKDSHLDATIIPNQFVDEFMKSANASQIKIYLYLKRMMDASAPTSLGDIADTLNESEKDVERALNYWEKQGILSLERNAQGALEGVRFLSLNSAEYSGSNTQTVSKNVPEPSVSAQEEITSSSRSANKAIDNAEAASAKADLASGNTANTKSEAGQIVSMPMSEPVKKMEYSLDALTSFKTGETTAPLLFAIQTYLGRSLTLSDLQSLLFIYEGLEFSEELMDYLIEYCVGKSKRDFRYIEKVAMNWHQEHITTVRQAKLRSTRYEKLVYTAMKALGRNDDVTDAEAEFVRRWNKEFGFSEEVILYACEKCVLATANNRLNYTEGILSRWKQAGLKTLSEIKASEEAYAQNKKASGSNHQTATTKPNAFHNFEKRDYDFAALEKGLVKNQ